jgi:hypothetical protein
MKAQDTTRLEFPKRVSIAAGTDDLDIFASVLKTTQSYAHTLGYVKRSKLWRLPDQRSDFRHQN